MQVTPTSFVSGRNGANADIQVLFEAGFAVYNQDVHGRCINRKSPTSREVWVRRPMRHEDSTPFKEQTTSVDCSLETSRRSLFGATDLSGQPRTSPERMR